MISLVTPNYNGGIWLRECLDSVASQTADQENIEMLFIDDGSTDDSKEIVEEYRADIPGLKPTWHEHTGKPSLLRNLAINKALGEYVLFLDSDDYLGAEAIERLSEFVDQGDSDVVAFQLEGLNRSVPSSMLQETLSDADIVSSGLYKTLGIWKMCRKQFLDEHEIRFDSSIGRGDDVTFFAEAMLRAKRLSILSGYPFYTVRGREDGSSITQKEWDHNKRIDVAVKVGELAKQFARTESIADHFCIRLFNADLLGIISSPSVTGKTIRRLKSELGPYWNSNVANLIYSDESRRRLTDFFEGTSDVEHVRP